jgi:hypothetical protein
MYLGSLAWRQSSGMTMLPTNYKHFVLCYPAALKVLANSHHDGCQQASGQQASFSPVGRD